MSLLPKFKKDPRTLSKLEKERELKRIAGETEEIIDTIGQESERKAVRPMQEYMAAEQKADQLQKELDVEQLKNLSRNKIHYQRYLLVILNRFIKDEDIPKQYHLFVESNDQGIAIGIEGTDYISAFRVCGMPKYDIHACKVLAVKVGNTVAIMEGHLRQTDSGIIMATKEELNIALRNKRHGRSS
jgi:hypothetical protein